MCCLLNTVFSEMRMEGTDIVFKLPIQMLKSQVQWLVIPITSMNIAGAIPL